MKAAAPRHVREEVSHDGTRSRIIAAATELLSAGGRDALTTRAVAEAAGVQAPTLYRLFGDKRGLLDVVAEHGLSAHLFAKAARMPCNDPIEDYRTGWDLHVAFGLAQPALFAIIYGEPREGRASPAIEAGYAALEAKIGAMAAAGLLRVSEPRAAALTHAGCVGAVLTLLAAPERERDAGLASAAREAVLAAIANAVPVTDVAGAEGAATTLRARLGETAALTPGERHLLGELLARIAAGT